jgi:poly-gamma-glutamate synthesis protein (capsule biosynthesis protein)
MRDGAERGRTRARWLAPVALAAAAILVAVEPWASSSSRPSSSPAVGGDDRAAEESDARPRRATLAFTGDLLIHSPVYYRAQALAGGGGYDFAPLFARIRPYVARADLAVCHLEVPMTPAPVSSYPIFNAPPDLAKGIARTGWDACTTASNHTLDQHQEGIGATNAALRRAGVAHTGSYASAARRRKPLIVDAGGIAVALLAYTSDTNGLPVPNPWSVNLLDPKRVLADARRARAAGAEAVIVNVHWASEIAPEYVAAPNAAQRAVARRLLRSPHVTALVGQGPHVAQPIRRIAGKYVVFSEGNLISSQSPAAGLAAASQDGYVAILRLVADEEGARVARVRYVPIWVSHPDFTVLPVGRALRRGWADAATLRASWERTVSVAGRGRGIRPIPARLR